MTQEEDLLKKVLCTMLPYGVKVYGNYLYSDGEKIVGDKKIKALDLSTLDWFVNGIEIKPYLRPMSSMTDEEKKELRNKNILIAISTSGKIETTIDGFDWLNAHHFDYRSLIKMGLALEAPKGMYNEG